MLYSPTTNTPRTLLLSLPGITEEKLDAVSKKLEASTSTRIQRALMLELLDGLRGVAMSEKGKVTQKPRLQDKKAQMIQQQHNYRQDSPDLGGVADMFA